MVFLHIDTKNYDEKNETGETPIAIFNKFIKDGKHIFALIYMEGCGPCNATRPEWKKLEGVLKKGSMDDDDFLIVDIDKDRDYVGFASGTSLTTENIRSTLFSNINKDYRKLYTNAHMSTPTTNPSPGAATGPASQGPASTAQAPSLMKLPGT